MFFILSRFYSKFMKDLLEILLHFENVTCLIFTPWIWIRIQMEHA